MGWSIFKSKTFWGAVVVAGGKILGDHSVTSVVEAVGTVITIAGARDAVAKIPANPAS
jgi:hypothetical protein